MTDRRLFVEITVEGDAARVFKEIGVAAREAAKDIVDSGARAEKGVERIEKAADAAEKEVKELGKTQERVAKSAGDLEKAQTEAAKATREMAEQSAKGKSSLDDYRRAVTETARGMGLLGGAFTLYARQAREHEITVAAVQRIYGEAADSYVAFANTIQSTTIFSNDEALEAARLMGTLKENYGLVDAEIQQLIQTSADLAAMHGYTLTDAAMRVQSAIRGEAESAEMLGLTMNQASIDTEGLTLTMSNAEAAQFRYNAMMEQTASSVGFAAEAANTTTGRVQQLANQTQDAVLAFVGFTGPVGEAAAGMSAFGIQGGMAAAGLIQLSVGIRTAAAAAGGFTALLGPAGLVVAGLGAAAIAAKLFADSMRDDAAEAMKSARLEAEQLDAVISAVTTNLAGIERTFAAAIIGSDDALDRLQEHLDYWQGLIDTWGSFPVDRLHLPASAIEGLDEATRASIESQRQAIAYMQEYADEFGSVEQAANALAEAERDLSTILQHRGAGRQEILTQLAELNEAYQNQRITISEYMAALDELEQQRFKIDNDVILAQLETEQAALIDQQTEITATTNAWIDFEQQQSLVAIQSVAMIDHLARQTIAMRALNGELQLWSGAEAMPNISVGPMAMRWATMGKNAIDAQALAMAGLTAIIGGGEAAWRKYGGTLGLVTRQTESLDTAVEQLTASTKDELSVSIVELEAQFETAMRAASGLGDALYNIRAQGGTVAVDMAVNTGGAQQALRSGFGAIVGGAQGMGQLADQTAEWAASLAHGNMGQTELDNLLLKGAISAKTYGAALSANHRIQQANVSVQEDVLRIQAKQLPVMAELAEQHARWVDALADEDVATQTIALGYMDQTKASQAMALATLNATAAMSGMKAIAAETTIEMAKADPVLKAMLIDMGLISEGANGTITMNTDQAVSATDVLSALNDTLNDLTLLLAQVFNVDITATDGATTVIDRVKLALADLDGSTASVYVATIGGGLTLGAATGTYILPDAHAHAQAILPRGVSDVPGLATGGHLRQINEVGTEMVVLPTGATVINAAGTRGRLDPLGRGRDSGGSVHNYRGATVHQTITLDDSALSTRSRRLAGRRR